ncbi:sugar nucleotide-binding protein [Mycobacterium sp.]|uniref:SDR family oxidoreductase n=1 Tax=Mycobacterium sp. TaxID=1785 RepID=UPI0031E19C9E
MPANAADVLVLGAGGRLGEVLARLLPGFGLSVRGVSRHHVDVRDHAALTACIEATDPRVVVYAAAMADPDRCERDPSASHDVNVAGAVQVTEAAARIGCRVIYYSSDYVFGEPGRYFEDAPVSPLQVYGQHKAEAEQLVLGRGDNVVIRLPLLFGNGRDTVSDLVRAVVQGTPLARDDRRRYPIPLRHVVTVTAMIVSTGARCGIYHAVGVDSVTKIEWACYIAGLLGRPVSPATATGSPLAARPADVELASRRPEMCAPAGTLWEATRARVVELSEPLRVSDL